MFAVSGDPVADFERWDAEQERRIARRPRCTECGEHIQEMVFYEINGEPVCCECLDIGYRKFTEDYIE